MHISELQMRVHETAIEHGWWDQGERNFGEMIALMHSELSEALEAWRNSRTSYDFREGKAEGWAVELIDCIIRILDFLAFYGIDAGLLLQQKDLYNTARPYRHGGKRI